MKNALPAPVEVSSDDNYSAEPTDEELDIEARELARLIIDCYKGWQEQEDAKPIHLPTESKAFIRRISMCIRLTTEILTLAWQLQQDGNLKLEH